MAARGAAEKEIVTKLILKIFKDSFVSNKEIRIPVMSAEGEEIQIKVALTAAKTNIDRNGKAVDVEVPANAGEVVSIAQFTDEEKQALIKTLSRVIDIDYAPVPKMRKFVDAVIDDEPPF